MSCFAAQLREPCAQSHETASETTASSVTLDDHKLAGKWVRIDNESGVIAELFMGRSVAKGEFARGRGFSFCELRWAALIACLRICGSFYSRGTAIELVQRRPQSPIERIRRMRSDADQDESS
jgi:hypothetical protein